MWIRCTSVTDSQTDGRTGHRATAKTAHLRIASRGKNDIVVVLNCLLTENDARKKQHEKNEDEKNERTRTASEPLMGNCISGSSSDSSSNAAGYRHDITDTSQQTPIDTVV